MQASRSLSLFPILIRLDTTGGVVPTPLNSAPLPIYHQDSRCMLRGCHAFWPSRWFSTELRPSV